MQQKAELNLGIYGEDSALIHRARDLPGELPGHPRKESTCQNLQFNMDLFLSLLHLLEQETMFMCLINDADFLNQD